MMTIYANHSRDSGVVSYDIGYDHIRVTFRGGKTYRYSCQKAGRAHVNRMKQLAKSGRGLATYISQYVRDKYD